MDVLATYQRVLEENEAKIEEVQYERRSFSIDDITLERFPSFKELMLSKEAAPTMNVKRMRYPLTGKQAQRFIGRLIKRRLFVRFTQDPTFKAVGFMQ